MLSSLGARRDRSRSPSEGRPPSKVFIQEDEETPHQTASDARGQSPQRSFVPKIVVQEYGEEQTPSSPSARASERSSPQRQEADPQHPDVTAQEQRWRFGRQQLDTPQSEAAVQVDAGVQRPPERSSSQQAAATPPQNLQDLQSRKAQAVKNRPWLQTPAAGGRRAPDATAGSSQGNLQSAWAQPEGQGAPQQGATAGGEQQKQIQQQTKREEQQKDQGPKRQEERPPGVRGASGPSAPSAAPFTHPPQAEVKVQPPPQTPQAKPPDVAYSPAGGSQTQVHTHVPPQLSPPQVLGPEPAVAHPQVWAQVRPSSPMQASLHGHIQPPAPSHLQLRSPPQSWAPVRPPSPKPPGLTPSHTQTPVQPGPRVPQPQHLFPQGQISHFTQTRAPTSGPAPQPYTQPPFYPQGYLPPAQPWGPRQEVQAAPQQYPTLQPHPQQRGQAPESPGSAPSSVPPQWPQGGPQGAPPVCSLETSYFQPHMQTEALPPTTPWGPTGQRAPMRGYDLFQTRPGQVQQHTWLQTSSQHLDYSHTQVPSHPQTPESPERILPSAQLPPQEVQPGGVQPKPRPTEPQPVPDQAPGGLREDPRPQKEPIPPQAQSPPQPRPEGQTPLKPPTVSPPQTSPTPPLSQSPDLCVSPPTLSQAPPQAYTEAYTKAQALARNGFEEAKHCLQEHILETISIFQDKSASASLKQVNPPLILAHDKSCDQRLVY